MQNDACIQTLGVDEPENTSLRHINGKLQITKTTNMSQRCTTNNNTNTYNVLNQNIYNEQLSLQQQFSANNNQYSSRLNNGLLAESSTSNNNTNYSNNTFPIRKQQVPPPLLDFSFKNQKNYDPNYYSNHTLQQFNQTSNFQNEDTYNKLESMKPSGYSRPNNFYANKIEDQYYQRLNSTPSYNNQMPYDHRSHQEQSPNLAKITTSPFYYSPNTNKLLSPPHSAQRQNSSKNENVPISPSRYYQPKLLVKHSSPSQYKIAEIQNTNNNNNNSYYEDEQQKSFNTTNASSQPHEDSYDDNQTQSLPPQPPPKTRSRKSSKSSTTMPNNFSLSNTHTDKDDEKQNQQHHVLPPSAKPRANNSSIIGSVLENVMPIVVPHTPSAKPRVKTNEKSVEASTFFIEVTPKTFTAEVMSISSSSSSSSTNETLLSPKRPAFIDPSVPVTKARPKDRKSKSLNPQPKPRHSVQTNNDYSSYDCVESSLLVDDEPSNKITSLPDPSSSSNESSAGEENNSTSEFSSSSSSNLNVNKQEIYSTRFKTNKKLLIKNKIDSIHQMPSTNHSNSSTASSPSSSSRSGGSSGLVSSLSPQFDTTSISTTNPKTNSLSTIEPSSSTSSFISSSSNSIKTVTSSHLNQKENFGLINQIKNVFETTCDLPKNEKLPKAHAKLNFDLLSPPSTPSKLKKFNVKINTNNETTNTTTPSEYMNCSNKYLTLKAKSLVKEESVPPPPPTPPFPPTPPPPLTTSPLKQITTDNLVAKLITSSSHGKQTSDLISNQPQPSFISSSGSSSQANPMSTRPNRLMSNASSNYTMQSVKLSTEFRILSSSNHQSERSTTSGGNTTQQININQQLKMVHHLPDAVDVVKLNFEGQRRVVVPGYMTSADILRNMLLKNNNTNGFEIKPGGSDLKNVAPLIVKRQCAGAQMSLKEKLLMQNRQEAIGDYPNSSNNYHLNKQKANAQHGFIQTENLVAQKDEFVNNNAIVNDEDDEELARKFSRKNRTRSMSGLVTLDLSNNQNMQIIDIDFDYDDTKKQNQTSTPTTIFLKDNDSSQMKQEVYFG